MYTVKVYQLTKTFSKYLGNQKCLQTCQIELPGWNLGRVAPCECHFEKNERKWQRLKIEVRKIRQKASISPRPSIQFPHLTPLQNCQTMFDNIAVLCGRTPSHAQKVISQKRQKMAKTPILEPKIVILVNKKCFIQKTSAGTSSYIIFWWPHANFEANRSVQLWDRDFCQSFLCVS